MLRFKLFSCCVKKCARHSQYRKHKQIIEERMDIVNFISNEGHVSLLSKLLIKPCQLKLISHVSTTSEALKSKTKALQMEEAVTELKTRELDLETTRFESKINRALINTIKNQLTESDIQKDERGERTPEPA